MAAFVEYGSSNTATRSPGCGLSESTEINDAMAITGIDLAMVNHIAKWTEVGSKRYGRLKHGNFMLYGYVLSKIAAPIPVEGNAYSPQLIFNYDFPVLKDSCEGCLLPISDTNSQCNDSRGNVETSEQLPISLADSAVVVAVVCDLGLPCGTDKQLPTIEDRVNNPVKGDDGEHIAANTADHFPDEQAIDTDAANAAPPSTGSNNHQSESFSTVVESSIFEEESGLTYSVRSVPAVNEIVEIIAKQNEVLRGWITAFETPRKISSTKPSSFEFKELIQALNKEQAVQGILDYNSDEGSDEVSELPSLKSPIAKRKVSPFEAPVASFQSDEWKKQHSLDRVRKPPKTLKRDPKVCPNFSEKIVIWKENNRILRRNNIIFKAEKLVKRFTSPNFNPATILEDSKVKDAFKAADVRGKSKQLVNGAIFKARTQSNGGDKYAAKEKALSKCEANLCRSPFAEPVAPHAFSMHLRDDDSFLSHLGPPHP